MTVPKQRRTREHRRDRRARYALKSSVAQPHRISKENPVYKGRDYSDLFEKKSDK